jgi:hypothetical protein
MPYEFNLDLQFQGGFVNGMLGGKLLNCLVDKSLPGSMPVAGVYQIQPPVQDGVFGLLAVMTPVGGAGGGGKQDIEWTWGGGSAVLIDKLVGAGGGSASFVLSSRPIPGRNCLVIRSNFADLMDALKSAGGATIKFS